MIELLVVLVIIGLLGALLISSMRGARSGVRRVYCANNLRQIGIACHMYADDNDERLPPYGMPGIGGRWWWQILDDYLDDRSVWECPEAPERSYVTIGATELMAFGYNIRGVTDTTWAAIMRLVSSSGKRISELPSRRILMADSLGDEPGGTLFLSWLHSRIIRPNFSNEYPSKRHSNGCNVLFADGSVKWYLRSSILVSPDGTMSPAEAGILWGP